MLSVNHLLAKFRNLLKNRGEDKKIIARIIKSSAGILINEESITLSYNNSITIKCHPALKSGIFLKKGEILRALNQELKPQKFEELL